MKPFLGYDVTQFGRLLPMYFEESAASMFSKDADNAFL
jgi:hypothetical protein